jgi:radical SAM superfamily enzyme YgiQ (UPF0313 family)
VRNADVAAELAVADFPQEASNSPGPPATAQAGRCLSICIINPRFEPSNFGFDYALPIFPGDKRANMITGALPAVAGLVPDGHHVELVDENIEEIDFEGLRRFDVIGVTGMVVQRQRMVEILERLKPLPGLVVVGGPYVTVDEACFEGLCDARFIGEAEETWPRFVRDLAAGRPIASRYQQAEPTDMTTVPRPRFDLVKSPRYLSAPVQFSRGCPFRCEFCDIIVIFGRRPRTKLADQVIAELDAVRAAGFRYCFLVDDNFIGNKREAKKLLREIVAWQERHGYPLALSTEASVDLADDAELLELMCRANFRQVFLGIETPRADSLKETKKIQNLRGDPLIAKVRRVRDAGLVVTAGFIVGFDHDDEAIFEEQFRFIQESGIAQVYIGILTPIPTTPLYERLRREGRLDLDDPVVLFRPLRMSKEQLAQGFEALLGKVYTPKAYFERLLRGYRESDQFRAQRAAVSARMPKPGLRSQLQQWLGIATMATRLVRTLWRAGRLRDLGGVYLRTYWRENRKLGKDAIGLGPFLMQCALQWHYFCVVQSRMHGYVPSFQPSRSPRREPPLEPAAAPSRSLSA